MIISLQILIMPGRGLAWIWVTVSVMFAILCYRKQAVDIQPVTGVDTIEGGPPAKLCVNTTSIEGIKLTIGDGTAIAGLDYKSVPTTGLSLPGCVEIFTIDDSEQEATEYIFATVTYPSSNDDRIVVIYFTDNDVTISLPAEVTISEGVAGGTVQVCAEISGGSEDATITSTINATLDSSPASAVADKDYITVSVDVSFAEGSMDGNTLCINVSIIDDMALEEDETFNVSMTVTAGDATVGNTATVVTIIDDDAVSVSIPAMVSVAEGDGMVSVCATLSALDVTEKNFAITLTTSDKIGFMRFLKRGAFGGSDYTSVSTDEFFPSGSTNGSIRCVNITIEDDNSLEENETFTVTVTAAPDVVLEATITIVDNDAVSVTIPATMSVSEGDGMVHVCAKVSAVEEIQRDFTVTFATIDGTATTDLHDYAFPSSKKVFTSLSVMHCVNIVILNDVALEWPETFTMALTTSDPNVMLENNVTTITIYDNDVTVSLSVPSMIYVGEGDDKVQVCASALMPPGVSERKAIVTLTTSDDTARSDSDYTRFSADIVLAIPPDSGVRGCLECIAITIQDDSVLEGNETFALRMTSPDPDVILQFTSPPGVIIKIIDNDDVSVSVPASIVNVSERDGTIPVCVTLFNANNTERDFTTSLTTIVGTATAGVALSYDVIFKSGSSDGDRECVNVTIMDNSVLGVLVLTTSDPSVKVANHFATITILANKVSVSIPTMVSVGEDDGMVQVCVTLSAVEDTERNFNLTLVTRNGTALAGIDYDALSFDGIFEKCVNITIIKDDLFEFDETFTLVLNASDPNVNIGNNVTTITITDKDEITVEFQNINITTSEVAGSVKVCVLIAYGTLGRNLTIHLSTMGVHGKNISSSAKDNTSPALTLTPTIPVACDEFDITVDNVHEGKEEEFTVVISSTDPSDRVSTNNSTAVITVHRNAHKTFYGDVVGFRLWVCQIVSCESTPAPTVYTIVIIVMLTLMVMARVMALVCRAQCSSSNHEVNTRTPRVIDTHMKKCKNRSVKEVDSKSIEEVDSRSVKEVDSKSVEVDPRSIKEVISGSVEEVNSRSVKDVDLRPVDIAANSILSHQSIGRSTAPENMAEEFTTRPVTPEFPMSPCTRSEENVSTNSRSSAEKVLQSSLPARFAEKVTAKGQQLSLPAGSAEEVKDSIPSIGELAHFGIINMVSSEWRDLGRHLGLTTNKMDGYERQTMFNKQQYVLRKGRVTLRSLKLIKWKGQRFRLVDHVSSKWESFGFRLEVPQDKLEAWRVECLGTSTKCWMKVMAHWLLNGGTPDYPVTWEGLYLLLEDVECSEVAENLKAIIAKKY